MGCWGITAFESDVGLDAVDFIRRNLPEDGKLYLEKIIEALRQDNWNVPADAKDVESHTSSMALAEMLIKFLDRDIDDLDYKESRTANKRKFSAITSFTASRESVLWLRDYISDTLEHARENAKFRVQYGEKWGGWFKEKDWIGWQEHMTALVNRLDTLLGSQENHFELISSQEQQNVECNKNDSPNGSMDRQVLDM